MGTPKNQIPHSTPSFHWTAGYPFRLPVSPISYHMSAGVLASLGDQIHITGMHPVSQIASTLCFISARTGTVLVIRSTSAPICDFAVRVRPRSIVTPPKSKFRSSMGIQPPFPMSACQFCSEHHRPRSSASNNLLAIFWVRAGSGGCVSRLHTWLFVFVIFRTQPILHTDLADIDSASDIKRIQAMVNSPRLYMGRNPRYSGRGGSPEL